MSTFTPGQQLLITDPEHPKHGCIGAYDFTGTRKVFMVINGLCWPVDKNKVTPVDAAPAPEPPPYESEDQYAAAARLCACLAVIAVIGLWAASTF